MITLKIGRHTYEITDKDIFLDNGACIQLMTQSKEKVNWGKRSTPVLSKTAIKQIKDYEKKIKPSKYPDYCTLFSLVV